MLQQNWLLLASVQSFGLEQDAREHNRQCWFIYHVGIAWRLAYGNQSQNSDSGVKYAKGDL